MPLNEETETEKYEPTLSPRYGLNSTDAIENKETNQRNLLPCHCT